MEQSPASQPVSVDVQAVVSFLQERIAADALAIAQLRARIKDLESKA